MKEKVVVQKIGTDEFMAMNFTRKEHCSFFRRFREIYWDYTFFNFYFKHNNNWLFLGRYDYENTEKRIDCINNLATRANINQMIAKAKGEN